MFQQQPTESPASVLIGRIMCLEVLWHEGQGQAGQIRGKPGAREPSSVPNCCWAPGEAPSLSAFYVAALHANRAA